MINQKNRRYWKDIAKEYDQNVGEKGDIRHELIVNPFVFQLMGNLKSKKVLDAGCGNGYLTRKMAKSAKQVIGVDITEELIEIAKNKDNPQNVEFIQANLESLPFVDGYFDSILSNLVLVDIERLDKVIHELGRVIRRSGDLVVSILHPCFENPPRTYSIFDNNGGRIGRVVQRYFDTGLVIDKNSKMSNGQFYQHYHHKISDYLNSLVISGFSLEEMIEPNGVEINKENGLNDQAPTFLLMKLVKS